MMDQGQIFQCSPYLDAGPLGLGLCVRKIHQIDATYAEDMQHLWELMLMVQTSKLPNLDKFEHAVYRCFSRRWVQAAPWAKCPLCLASPCSRLLKHVYLGMFGVYECSCPSLSLIKSKLPDVEKLVESEKIVQRISVEDELFKPFEVCICSA